MLSTSLPSAVFVEDGVAIGMVRPIRRQPREAGSDAVTQTSLRLSVAPRWLSALRELSVTTS